MSAEFWRYELTALGPLCIGERVKKGTHRPCLTKAIPFSSIVGALRPLLGFDYDQELVAAGYLTGYESKELMVYAPGDVALGGVKLPLTAELLWGARGLFFVDTSDTAVRQALANLKPDPEITIGAMKSAGFGRCRISKVGEERPEEPVRGSLLSRVPLKYADRFGIKGIQSIHKARYGYLFKPANETTGVYLQSLYEGSDVDGYSFLVKEGDAT